MVSACDGSQRSMFHFVTFLAEWVSSYGVQRERNTHPFVIKTEIPVLHALGRVNLKGFWMRKSLEKLLRYRSWLL